MGLVNITDSDIYGKQERQFPGNPDIKVTFALDIPASVVRMVRGLDIEKDQEKFVNAMITTIILEWNIAKDGVLLEISPETVNTKLSASLQRWIIDEILSVFLVLGKSRQTN